MKPITLAAILAVSAASACDRPAKAPASNASGETAAAELAAQPAPAAGLPAGAYKIDPTHTTVHFRVHHLGFSQYTGQFERVTGDLQLDPANPSAAQLNVAIDAASLALPAPPPGFLAEMKGPQWLDAAKFAQITYRSTAIAPTGPNTADITGDLTLHGVTRPVVLKAKFNGGYVGHPMDPNARIGFSATGVLKRSDFGISYGVPAPGTTMGVGDEVQVIVETEFTGPPLPGAAPASAQ